MPYDLQDLIQVVNLPSLDEPFSSTEIRVAMQDMPSDHAPGPDSGCSGSYRSYIPSHNKNISLKAFRTGDILNHFWTPLSLEASSRLQELQFLLQQIQVNPNESDKSRVTSRTVMNS
jgi:hypothetical protein